MNDNDRIDTYMNDTLQNGDVSSVIGLLKSHTLTQAKKSSKLNDINIIVDNVDDNGDYCYINSSTIYVINNHNSVDYTKKINKFSINIYLRGYNGLSGGVYIDDMLPAFASNQ